MMRLKNTALSGATDCVWLTCFYAGLMRLFCWISFINPKSHLKNNWFALSVTSLGYWWTQATNPTSQYLMTLRWDPIIIYLVQIGREKLKRQVLRAEQMPFSQVSCTDLIWPYNSQHKIVWGGNGCLLLRVCHSSEMWIMKIKGNRNMNYLLYQL